MPYDPTEAALEDKERAAYHASRAALSAPILPGRSAAYLNRTREAAAALNQAAYDLWLYRFQRDPAGYAAHEAWRADQAAGEYHSTCDPA